MDTITLDFDDESLQIVTDYAAEHHLPVQGAITLALINAAAQHGVLPIPMKPANEHLADLADAIQASPPASEEEALEIAERLRYLAQFITTRPIPDFNSERSSDRPNSQEEAASQDLIPCPK